jgi:hypothetical protein
MKAKKYWRKDWRQENLDLYNGDHWDFWIGPKVDENEPNAQEFNAAIERVFQTNNLIRNCIDRHVRALIGRFPNWFFKDESGDRVEADPKEGDEATPNSAATEAELLIQRWIDRIQSLSQTQEADMGDPFKKAVKDLAVAGEAYLRIWTPKRFENADDPIRRVAIHSPDMGAIELIYDADKFLEKIYYRYQIDNVDYIESQFIDEITGETVIQTLDSNEKQLLDDEEIRLNLGRALYRL